MGQLRGIFIQTIVMTVFGFVLSGNTVWADEGHGHSEEKMEKKMDMHHHAAPSKKGPDLPEGTKEVKIMLSGPFCSKHPEEITAELMKLKGVIHIEAFSGRDYILVHYDGHEAETKQMVAAVDVLKGSGWRCDAALSTERRMKR